MIFIENAYLGTNGDRNRIGLGSEDKLRTARVEQRKLLRVCAQSGIELLNEEPADLILSDLALLLLSGGGGSRGGGLGRLEVGRSVQSCVSRVESLRVAVLGGEVSVDRSLHVGHGAEKGFGLRKCQRDRLNKCRDGICSGTRSSGPLR